VVRRALFQGLVIDENDHPVEVDIVGGEAYYVVDDDGFRRHIECEYVDRQVLEHFQEMIRGHEELVTTGTMDMLGQDDIFTKAIIENQLKNMDAQFDAILEQGLPEEARAYLGMLGFRVVIDMRGDVIRVDQPEVSDSDEPYD
jgi:hypothetical protein